MEAWSAPSAIGTAGVGVGGQAGAEMTDFLVVLNSRSAIRSFMAAGSLTLGGNMSIALGPLGRNGEASGALNTNGKVAAMYSYSKTRGLFGGVSVEGSVIVERQDANALAYKSPVTARLLLGGVVEPPHWAMPLIKTLEACTGMPGNRQWINDEGSRTPGTYAFGGVSSPGPMSRAPSFLRKKKKSETPPFPPESWGEETGRGSYFDPPAPQSHSRNFTWDGSSHSSPGSFRPRFESDFNPDRHATLVGSTMEDTLSSPTGHYRTTSLGTQYKWTNPEGSLYFSSTLSQEKALFPDEGIARAIALFDFNAVESGDLSFRKGDVIRVTKKSDSIDDWWSGNINGRQGIFPANFVEIV
ncbi:hypothetical protein M413DRAFT_439623 [Hebeloma cylindrosporum]|uniref:SH3 domain-containing protein n=1 Tax=Hebeloma cylindrosporum TaxID=76867 RepID=A0A0C2Z3W7_HEBCY|nr:hypothetical protein M413DRAFT_439623 [Hebeloma cylindrosporum h7]